MDQPVRDSATTAISTQAGGDIPCVYPHCDGTLSTSARYCPTCRLPIRACPVCGEANRSQATYCRICGEALEEGPAQNGHSQSELRPQPPYDRPSLEAEPIRLTIAEPIPTLPQAESGFLWAVGDEGSLYRINPHEKDGRPVDVCTRLWLGSTAHSFGICQLERSPGSPLMEAFAVVATSERIVAWGLVSHATRVFGALAAGEEILANGREQYQLIAAAGAFAYCLTRAAAATSLMQINLLTAEVRRHTLNPLAGQAEFCGPVIVHDRVVVWSSGQLLTLTEMLKENGAIQDPGALSVSDAIERQPLPPGVELWTAPGEDSVLRLPLGRPPCMVVAGSIYLPCNHYGAPALLRAQAVSAGWALTTIPIPVAGGTLAQDEEGNPLLASGGRLLRCIGSSFREVAADDQLSSRFAGFHTGDLSIFFCEGEYGVRSHRWLQAQSDAGQQRVNWSPAGNQRLKECGGFWIISGALVAQLLVEDRQTTTEFLSWGE